MDRPVLLIVAAGLVGLVSCGGDPVTDNSPSDVKAWAGIELSVTVPQGLGVDETWQVLFEDWSARTGARPQLVTQVDESGPPLTSDVAVIPVTSVPQLDARVELLPVPETLDLQPVLGGLRQRLCQVGRKARLVPISTPVLVLYVRRDLLEASGKRLPKTWSEYQQLLEELDEWAGDLTAVEPWGEEFRATMFLARAVSHARHPANYSLFFEINRGDPLIDSPAFVRALREAGKALKKMPDEVRGYTPEDCRRELLAGRAAMAVSFEPEWPESTAVERAEPVRVSFSRLPGVEEIYNRSSERWEPVVGRPQVTSLVGFAGLVAVVRSEAKAAAAWDLVTEVLVERRREALDGSVRGLCWQEDIETAAEWLEGPLAADERSGYARAVAAGLDESGVVLELGVLGRKRFLATLSQSLGQWLAGATSVEEALSSTAREWRTILDEVGPEAVRDSYRRSLGLSAIGQDTGPSRRPSRR